MWIGMSGKKLYLFLLWVCSSTVSLEIKYESYLTWLTKLKSRSWKEVTRQITPPTEKTAMQHHQSNKKELSVNPCCVWTWWNFSVLSRLELQVGWLCVVVVSVVALVVVCGCGCGCGCGVWLWGDTLKNPCVRSKRRRVYRQHLYMCKLMWVWYRYTRGRFERTDGEREGEGVIVSSAYQNLPTSGYHVLHRFNTETLGSFPLSVWEYVENNTLQSPPIIRFTWTHCWTPDTWQTQTRIHRHSTTQHNKAHTTPQHRDAKRREEEVKETKRDRDEKRYKWWEERRVKERRER